MFEYHGWIRIWASPSYEDYPLSDETMAAIRALVESMSGYALMKLHGLNGVDYIHMAGHPNHRGTHGVLIIDLFTQVGRLAPGSHGLLYIYDDEDQTGLNNEYQVYRMVRGKVTLEKDPFLSPVVGLLEDPDPLSDPHREGSA